jgi:hypothetical protein
MMDHPNEGNTLPHNLWSEHPQFVMNLVTPQKLAAIIVQQSVVTGDTPWRSHRYMKQVVTRSETRINTASFKFSSITHGTIVAREGGRLFSHRDWLAKDKIAQKES